MKERKIQGKMYFHSVLSELATRGTQRSFYVFFNINKNA